MKLLDDDCVIQMDAESAREAERLRENARARMGTESLTPGQKWAQKLKDDWETAEYRPREILVQEKKLEAQLIEITDEDDFEVIPEEEAHREDDFVTRQGEDLSKAFTLPEEKMEEDDNDCFLKALQQLANRDIYSPMEEGFAHPETHLKPMSDGKGEKKSAKVQTHHHHHHHHPLELGSLKQTTGDSSSIMQVIIIEMIYFYSFLGGGFISFSHFAGVSNQRSD